jgi:hypothetical protein
MTMESAEQTEKKDTTKFDFIVDWHITSFILQGTFQRREDVKFLMRTLYENN